MEQVTAFAAVDGELFKTQKACDDYDAGLAAMDDIRRFQDSKLNPYPTKQHALMETKTIIAWERFKREDKSK